MPRGEPSFVPWDRSSDANLRARFTCARSVAHKCLDICPAYGATVMTATVPTTLPKIRRVRVYTRLSHPLRKRLAEYCAAAGRSERAVIEDAVGQYLQGHSSAPARRPLERL